MNTTPTTTCGHCGKALAPRRPSAWGMHYCDAPACLRARMRAMYRAGWRPWHAPKAAETRARWQQWADRYTAGDAVAAIARDAGTSTMAVRAALYWAFGSPLPARVRQAHAPAAAGVERAVRAVLAGSSQRQAAQVHGVSRSAVQAVLAGDRRRGLADRLREEAA